MAIFKCKMCGGDLELQDNQSVGVCEFCGTKQTLPKLDDDRRANLYDRANHFRRNNEFDKAMGIYEQILNEDKTDAEAYWSLVLCRYGIEYVEDPATHKRIPTVNRAQFTSVFDDDNYKSALQYADGSQRGIYEAEAKAINEIQKGILAISQNEEPFDVFICYKESDNNGRRTPDSVLANDLYHQLTQEGFKVFFARITLEDKLGTAYEPYIFAALNSAKVMVVLGTKPEYFKAVWVKNEWSRYLSLIKNGAKKILIPAYKDMDPYDLPEEFSHLQAQDMSKLGFMQDLIRGIKKLTQTDAPASTTVVRETVVNVGANTAPLLKRAFMFLEDGEWSTADEYCEKVLDIDPECAEAYVGKLMAELKVHKQENLKDCENPFCGLNNYKKAVRFADSKLKEKLAGYIEHIITRNAEARQNEANKQMDTIYRKAMLRMESAKSATDYKNAAHLFFTVSKYLDADALAKKCSEYAIKYAEEDAKRAEEERQKQAEEMRKLAEEEEKRAEEERKRAEEKPIVTMLYKGYIAAVRTETIQQEIDALDKEKSSLGLFSVKRKKEITEKICIMKETVQSIIEESKKLNLPCTATSQALREKLNEFDLGRKRLKKLNDLRNVRKGEYITFGEYEQANNTGNGKEEIEWLVLDVQDGKALVISKYGLVSKPYHIDRMGNAATTWETCFLRKWLNNDFISSAFSAGERALIPTVMVPAHKNPEYSTNPGNDTQDQVFLLSITEVNKYFESDSARQCKPTAYAVANGCWESDSGNCGWWLRSPDSDQDCAAAVDSSGHLGWGCSLRVTARSCAVRPALWIDLNF